MYMPITLGGGECYRLSSPIAAQMRDRRSDSTEIAWFTFIVTSIAIQIVYCISNTRGSSLMYDLSYFKRPEGVIKFHRDKPERDTMRRPQSRALSGLAKPHLYGDYDVF